MSRLPALTDRAALKARLSREERELARELAGLEDRVRRFEHEERPRYDAWVRVEFGPRLSLIDELVERIRERRLLVHRIEELMEREGLHPAEALWVATNGGIGEAEADGEPGPKRGGWDADEIEARRRAKLEGKRQARKERKAESRSGQKPGTQAPRSSAPSAARTALVSIYRMLARKLHPDSADAIRSDQATQLWHEVQAAYQSSDRQRLLAVAAWISELTGDSTESLSPTDSLSDRADRLRAMRSACVKLRKSIDALSDHPAWGFGTPQAARLKKLRARAAREIDEDLGRAQEAYQAFAAFLATIPTARPPKTANHRKRRGR